MPAALKGRSNLASDGRVLADERPAAPNPRNARTHTDEQIDQLVASIREFGWTNPILADPSDNDVIAGHGRLL